MAVQVANPSAAALYEDALVYETGSAITASGALSAYSGAKTGRSPSDKRIVDEEGSNKEIWWGPVNKKMSTDVRSHFSFPISNCFTFLFLPTSRFCLPSMPLSLLGRTIDLHEIVGSNNVTAPPSGGSGAHADGSGSGVRILAHVPCSFYAHHSLPPETLRLIKHNRSGRSTASVLSTTSTPGTAFTSSMVTQAGMSATGSAFASSALVPTTPSSCATC